MTNPAYLADRSRGWQQYPAHSGSSIVAAAHGKQISNRLTRCAGEIFSEDVNVRIIDIAQDGKLLSTTKAFTNAADVEKHLCKDEFQRPRVRVISLHSEQSIQPLEISECLLRKMLTFHNVDAAFLDVVFSFADVPNTSEAGSSNMSNNITSDGSRNISYQVRYVEENHRSKSHQYSCRQTGIYHHHSSAEDFDLFIIINPVEDSVLEAQLLELVQSRTAANDICKHPYRLHVLPFLLYTDNWRWYLRHLGAKFEQQVNVTAEYDPLCSLLTSVKDNKIKTLDVNKPGANSLKFDNVQDLRDLEDDTHSSNGHCKSAVKVAEMLETIPSSGLTGEWSLATSLDRLRDYNNNLPILTSKISNSIELHTYALDLRNQYFAANTNAHVSKLAEESTRDTTAVKWLTYLSLAYLPASFVATLYGMNLFLYSPASRSLIIAKNFWLYFATWLPLTALTVICYLLMKAFHKYRHPEDTLEAGLKAVKSL